MSGYTTAQASEIVGVSKTAILRWLREGLIPEPKRSQIGSIGWRMWSEADLKRARELKAKMRRGPKPRKK